jgi:NADH-quinone oxidoreductase subunit E
MSKVDAIIEQYRGQERLLTSLLQDVQAAYNYLPQEALERVAQRLDLPRIQVYQVAKFYKAFSLEPRGEHLITVCLGTACHVRGGVRIAEQVERSLGIAAGQTSKDGQFTLETVNCVGCCALGPIMIVDGKYHGKMAASSVERVLKQYSGTKEATANA